MAVKNGFKYDFSGYVTKNDLKCSDGRVIRKDAFAECDGEVVPLVWAHLHNEPSNVLGHTMLENRDDGVYGYSAFNNTENGSIAHALVDNGDIQYMSIYANQLRQDGNDVKHGKIREVSLVLAGANPGAMIDYVSFAHSDGTIDDSDEDAIIHTGIEIELADADEDDLEDDVDDLEDDSFEHADDDDKTIGDIWNTLNEKQEAAVYAIVAEILGEDVEDLSHADSDESDGGSGETVGEVFDTLTDEQKAAVYAIIGEIIDENESDEDEDDEELAQSGMENDMKKNVFDGGASDVVKITAEDVQSLMHSAMSEGSFKKVFQELDEDKRNAFLMHDATTYTGGDGNTYTTKAYGISNIGLLFPEARTSRPTPDFIQRNMDWVPKVLGGVHKLPYTRIRSMFADITEDEARAKGYVTGAQKTEEVFGLLKRETTPTTVYKKQKFDRDDVLDITDFDVIAWVRGEMRMMLDEEIARAILIGDGRSNVSPDKINENNIRPVWKDDDLYTTKLRVTASTTPEEMIDTILTAMDDYEGSPNPVLYAPRAKITQMKLIKDELGHRLYKSESEIADAMGVSSIVAVPVMKNQTNTVNNTTYDLFGIIVDLRDYDAGTDKGGQVTAFDDFDIDFNQMKYLIETRMSGALSKPRAAIAIEVAQA